MEAYVEYGEPLKLHELHIEELVKTLEKKGVKLVSSKIGPLTPKQSLICKDEARFKVVACGRRFGKSMLCTLIALAVLLQPGRKVWVVAKDYGLTDRVFKELYHLVVNELKLAKSKSMYHRFVTLKNGSEFRGKSCTNRTSLVGDAVDLIIWDEAALEEQAEDIWNQELRPCLTDRKGSAIFISTPRGRNHFYEWYRLGKKGELLRKALEGSDTELTEEEVALSDWSSYKFTSYANTIEEGGYLDRAEIDAARLTLPPLKFKQEYLADFTAVSNRSFPEFDFDVQIVDEDFGGHIIQPHNPEVFASMDFNYSTPCTTLYAQMDGSLNVFIFDEFVPKEAQTTVHAQAKQLLEIDKQLGGVIHTVVADIAGKQKDLAGRSAWDDLASWGIHPTGRKQRIETGCDLIRLWCRYPVVDDNGKILFEEDGITPVTYPKLFVHSRCENLIYALETATAQETQNGILKEGYKKDGKTDGPLDALRYLLVYLLHDSGYVGAIPVI